jgi:hypothetical protein
VASTKKSAMGALRIEKPFDEGSRVVRIFFWKKMAALHRLSLEARFVGTNPTDEPITSGPSPARNRPTCFASGFAV